MNDIKEIFIFLSLRNSVTLIGSSSNKLLKYTTDYDTQEDKLDKLDPAFILEMFQEKFKIAKQSENIYIMDLKAGVYNTIPVRWDYKTIMKGYQDIDDKRIHFVDTLHNDFGNVVKLDLIVYFDNMFHEFSCNYYFRDLQTQHKKDNSLLLDVRKYYFEEKYMKMLRRLYSYLIQIDKKIEKAKQIVSFFNSKAGYFYQLEHKTNVILDVMENPFRKVNKTQLKNAILELKSDTPRPFKSLAKKSSLQILSEQLHDQVNGEATIFINKL